MTSKKAGITTATVVSWFGLTCSSLAADIENGDELHFDHCTGCHQESIYTRDDRRVDSLQRLRLQVRFCKDRLGLVWFDEDVDDVVEFLNRNYYHFEN